MAEKGHENEISLLNSFAFNVTSFAESADQDVPLAQLNFVFIHDAGKKPRPLPLIVPRALFERPSADIRPIIINKLKDEGITVVLGDLYFWRVRSGFCFCFCYASGLSDGFSL